MQTWSQWIRESFSLTIALIRQQLAPLLAPSLTTGIVELWFEDAMQLASSSEKVQRWDLQIAVGLTDFVGGIVLLLILCWGIPKVRELKAASFAPKPFETPYLGSFLAEYLRMLAQTLMYALLLLLPGIYRYCQLIFVPLIALFSRRYHAGEVDALKLSQSLARTCMGRIFTSLAVTFALSVLLQFLPEILPDLHIWGLRLVFALLGDVVAVWAFALTYLLFESAMQNVENA